MSLTSQHKQLQTALAARTTRDLLAVWPLWEPGDRASWERFSRAAQLVIRARARQSAGLSSAYYKRLRGEARVDTPEPTIQLADVPVAEQLDISLVATAVVSTVAALRAGKTMTEAKRVGFVRASKVAERHVLNAGRQTLTQTAEADDAAAGYERVTEGTCDFCAGLAAEGTHEGAGFEAHDNCACSAEPVFTAENPREFPDVNGIITEHDDRVQEFLARVPKDLVDKLEGKMLHVTRELREVGGDVSALRDDLQDVAKAWDELIETGHTFKEPELLYRGVDVSRDEWFKPVVGEAWHDDGYMFTSMSKMIGDDYAEGGGGWLMEIVVNKGDKAMPYWRHDAMILPRGQTFKIVSVDKEKRIVRLVSDAS